MRRRRRDTAVPPGGGIPHDPGISRRSRRRQRSGIGVFKWVARGGGRAILQSCFWLLLGGGAAYGAYIGLQSYQQRVLTACVLTDVEYHEEKPDWQSDLKALFAEVNKAFAPSGVQWTYINAGEAYPSSVTGDMRERIERLPSPSTCKADVVLGLTGRVDKHFSSVSSPFSPVILLKDTAANTTAMSATIVARSLARLFGASANAQSF